NDVVYVGQVKSTRREVEFPDDDHPGIKAARAERRIREQLQAAGAAATKILELRFRIPLCRSSSNRVHPNCSGCRVEFGLVGKEGRTGAPKGRKLTLIAVRQTLARGPGAAAHLTEAAM